MYFRITYLSVGRPLSDDEGVVFFDMATHPLKPERKLFDASLVLIEPSKDVLEIAVPSKKTQMVKLASMKSP
jgi:hypothetical protein